MSERSYHGATSRQDKSAQDVCQDSADRMQAFHSYRNSSRYVSLHQLHPLVHQTSSRSVLTQDIHINTQQPRTCEWLGARCSSVVRAFIHGAMGHWIDPSWWTYLSYFSFQPVLHDWCNKGCGMRYPVCGMMHIK